MRISYLPLALSTENMFGVHEVCDLSYPQSITEWCIHSSAFSHRTCPKGIDPYPGIVGVDEEQLIDCSCPDDCSGSILLAFRGHSTRPIPFDSSAALVKYRLEVRTLTAE